MRAGGWNALKLLIALSFLEPVVESFVFPGTGAIIKQARRLCYEADMLRGRSVHVPRPGLHARAPDSPSDKDKSFEFRVPPVNNEIMSYDECGIKGKEVRAMLDEAITQTKPDTNGPKVQDLYTMFVNKKGPLDFEEQPPKGLEQLLIPDQAANNSYAKVTIINNRDKFKEAPEKVQTISRESYSKEVKAIFVHSHCEDNDLLPNDVRLSASEFRFQGWKTVAEGAVRDLKYIFRSDMAYTEASTTILEARRRLQIPDGEIGYFHPDAPGTAMDDAFNSLSGSRNIRTTYFMLTAHHQEFGNLKVVKFHTFPSFSSVILIELGR